MAKNKVVKSTVVVDPKVAAINKLYDWDKTPRSLLPAPTRSFEVGEQVIVGHLENVTILEKLEDGYAYLYSYQWPERNKQHSVTMYRASWWVDIEKNKDTSNVPRLFSPYVRRHVIYCDLSSILSHITNGGLVCDPLYQRGYVWTEENRVALIESIFDFIDIGSFLLLRNACFNHTGDKSTKTYRTITGELVKVKRCEDNTVAIIDGQQRLTTIINFVEGRWAYKGLFFSQLNIQDQREFLHTSVGFSIVDEDQTTDKEIIRMFLQANRGVPQTPEHLAVVQSLYDNM